MKHTTNLSNTTKLGLCLGTLLFTTGAHAFTVNVSGSGAMIIDGTNGTDFARIIGQGPSMVKVVDAGDDNTVVWDGEDIITSIRFSGKRGANTLALNGVGIDGPITVSGGSGPDILRVNGLLRAGRLSVDHGGGLNRFNATSAPPSEEVCNEITSLSITDEYIPVCTYEYQPGDVIDLDNGLTYDSGNGKDVVLIEEIMVADDNPAMIQINTAGGNDRIEIDGDGNGDGYIVYPMPMYDSEWPVYSYTADRIVVYSGAGNDTVTIRDSYLRHSAQVFSGAGNDTVTVENVEFGLAPGEEEELTGIIDVITGIGKDKAFVSFNEAKELNVNCGPDKDKHAVYLNSSEEETVSNCEVYLN